ncbi:MAG: exodeoxyribonuclease VII small subunit [Candidatus Saccharimonadales bacterium]
MSDQPNKKKLSDQLTELDELLAWFDQDDIDLDEALKKFDQGVALAEDIKKHLAQLENKITVLKERFDQT